MSNDRLTTPLSAAAGAPVVRPDLFAFFDLSPDPVRVWTGVGERSWNGHTWLGIGHMGSAVLEETAELRAAGASFGLTGVPVDLLNSVIVTEIHNRSASLWLAFSDEARVLLADPVLLFSGLMDTIEIEDGAQTATIVLRCENRLRDLSRPRVRRYTDADQQSEFPGDRGFQFVSELQEREIEWDATQIYSTGYIEFSGQPSSGATITLNGSVWTFVASITSGLQLLIGANLAITLQNVASILNASNDSQTAKCGYTFNSTRLTITFRTYTTAGNSYTLAVSSGANATVSGATLSGGAG